MLSPERTPQIPFRSTRSAGPPGINAEFIQALQKKGLVLNIEGIRVLRGGETGLAHGTYTSKYADPNMTPGRATGSRRSSGMAMAGTSLRMHPRDRRSLPR